MSLRGLFFEEFTCGGTYRCIFGILRYVSVTVPNVTVMVYFALFSGVLN